MREIIQMSRKQFYIIVGLCAVIILSSSLESMIRVKDLDMFELWLTNTESVVEFAGQTREQLYQTYLTMCLSTFFVRAITPIGLALHTYYVLIKNGVNKSYIAIWLVLIIGSVVFSIIGNNDISVFLIISLLSYIGIIVSMIFIKKEIRYAEML